MRQVHLRREPRRSRLTLRPQTRRRPPSLPPAPGSRRPPIRHGTAQAGAADVPGEAEGRRETDQTSTPAVGATPSSWTCSAPPPCSRSTSADAATASPPSSTFATSAAPHRAAHRRPRPAWGTSSKRGKILAAHAEVLCSGRVFGSPPRAWLVTVVTTAPTRLLVSRPASGRRGARAEEPLEQADGAAGGGAGGQQRLGRRVRGPVGQRACGCTDDHGDRQDDCDAQVDQSARAGGGTHVAFLVGALARGLRGGGLQEAMCAEGCTTAQPCLRWCCDKWQYQAATFACTHRDTCR